MQISTIFKTIVLSSVMAFAVGCGKENKSGSGVANYGFNPLIDPGQQQNIERKLTPLRDWYNDETREPRALKNSGGIVKETEMSNYNHSGGFQVQGNLCFFGWGNGCQNTQTKFTDCYIKSSSDPNNFAYNMGTPSSNGVCNITRTNITKRNNQDLADALNGKGLTLLDVQTDGRRYYLAYGQMNNIYRVPDMVYVIDISHDSQVNPIEIQDFVNKKRTSVKLVQPLN